jgi:hypothetical protein
MTEKIDEFQIEFRKSLTQNQWVQLVLDELVD